MRTVRRTFSIILGVAALLLVPGAAAQAAPVHMDITDAVLDLGGLSGVKAIDSSIPDPPATLTGELDGSDVTIPKEGFVFPPKSAEVTTGVVAEINMEANEDISGTFDPGTGQLSLAVSLKATVGVLGSTCVVSPINLALSTQNARPYLGVPYESGFDGNGAVSARWSGLPPVTGGGACGTVAGLIAGPGGIWMSHGIATPETCDDNPSHPGCDVPVVNPPDKAPKLTGGPADSTEATTATFTFEKGDGETQPVDGFVCSLDGSPAEACDSGTKEYTGLTEGAHTFTVKAKNGEGEGPEATRTWTVTKKVAPPPDKPRFSALKVAPKNKAVKRGKRVVLRAKVRNVGKARATGVRICVNAPKRFVKVKKCVRVGALAAGRTVTKKFVVTVKKRARRGKKVALKFKVTGKGAAAKAGRAVIRIR